MRDKFPLDIYTVLIVALVPAFLAIAWGLAWNYERVESKRACMNTSTYLNDVAAIAPDFTGAGTLQNTGDWLNRLGQMRPPPPASGLHDAVVSTVTYASNTTPGLDTAIPAVVYDEIAAFQNSINAGRDAVIKKCPELAAQLPSAFPMFFRDGAP